LRKGEIVVLSAGQRHVRTREGVRASPLEDAVKALCDDMGISREIAALNPPDSVVA
jgi:hypothetical protein